MTNPSKEEPDGCISFADCPIKNDPQPSECKPLAAGVLFSKQALQKKAKEWRTEIEKNEDNTRRPILLAYSVLNEDFLNSEFKLPYKVHLKNGTLSAPEDLEKYEYLLEWTLKPLSRAPFLCVSI